MKLPKRLLRKKQFNKAMLVIIFFALLSPFISGVLLISAVFAQSAQCLGQANAIVMDPSFTNSSIIAGTPFSVTIYVCDSNAQIDQTFNSAVDLANSTNSLSPTKTSNFTDGVWNGTLYITKTASPDTISMASGSSLRGVSTAFVVNPGNQEYLSLIGGSAQTGVVGTAMLQALSVKAIDQFGNPIPNIGVNYSIPGYPPNSSGQSLSSLSVTTNGSGVASSVMTLGSKIGTYTINASIGGGTNISSGVVFYENAVSGALSTIKITPISTILPRGGQQPFSITGTDVYQNPVALSTPTWSVVNGGGTVDANGDFTAGQTPGIYANTVKASIGSIGALSSVTVINEAVGSSGGGSSGSGSGEGSGASPTPTPTPTPSPTPTPTFPVIPSPLPTYLSPLKIDHVTINPNPVTVAAGGSVIINAQAYDDNNNPINDCKIDWQLSQGAGTLSQNYGSSTSMTAGTTPGNGTVIAVATDQTGSKSVTAQIIIQAVPEQQKILNTNIGGGHLIIKQIASPQNINVPFNIVILAEDNNNNILGTFTGPVSLEDTTHTLTPGTADVFASGIWNGNITITTPIDKDIVTAHGLGYSGTSNEFEVQGTVKPNPLIVLGKNLQKIIVQANQSTNTSKTNDGLRILAAGIAAGLGLLGSSVSIGFMSARGVEAIGRNPFARTKIQVALTLSLVLCLCIAALSVASVFFIK